MMRAAGAIARIRLRRVRLPLVATYVGHGRIRDSVDRIIVEIETQSGLTGLGDTIGHPDCFPLIAGLAQALLARSALLRQAPRALLGRGIGANRNGRMGLAAAAGLELALFDVAARAAGVPLAALFGGRVRTRIPVAMPLSAVGPGLRGTGRGDLIEACRDPARADTIAAAAQAAAARFGFTAFSYATAAASAEWDLAVMHGLRATLGPAAALRYDAAAAWPIARAVELARAMGAMGPEWLADPCDGHQALRRLRLATGAPVATARVVTLPEQVGAALRHPCAETWLLDPAASGGIDAIRDIAAAAALFGHETALISRFESGIGVVARLHLAAAWPERERAMECGVTWLARDVVAPMLPVEGGMMTVPDGPGLGVELDETAMRALTVAERVVQG